MSSGEAHKLADEADDYAREGKEKPAKRSKKAHPRPWLVRLVRKCLVEGG